MRFSKDFLFGAATAAYQIEGAAYEDGKGLSIWDVYSHQEGKVRDGHTGDIACNHYHKYSDDIKIMKEMGVRAYRMSISWPRIFPEGIGKVNEKGIAFYENVIDELLRNDIIPFVTLYHWDLPYSLYQKGGWLNRDIISWFSEYTAYVVRRLSDRVTHWITINEPQCFIGHGLQGGKHAPFLQLSQKDVLLASHNTMLAHGASVQTIRSEAKSDVKVGYAPVACVRCPKTNAKEDINAARKETFRTDMDSIMNAAWWSDPILLGKYPDDGVKYHEENMPNILPNDMKLIHQPLDFFGVNVYGSSFYTVDEHGLPVKLKHAESIARTGFDWPVVPEAIYWASRFFYERYNKPILITENGMSNPDWVMEDGKVHDPQRIDFMKKYLNELERAYLDGVDIMGYFHWSLMDNFEWAEGYFRRFGLIHVDFANGKRTWKDSAYFYKELIEGFYNSTDS